MQMEEEQRSLLLNSIPPCQGTKTSYAAGVFRGVASLLEQTAHRAGIVAALQSLQSQSVAGLVITASRDKACSSSGVRIIGPNGRMLTEQWETFADSLANADDPTECVSLIEKLAIEENIPFKGGQPAVILLGRNTFPDGESLLRAAKQGISSIVGAVFHDMGILTAPQLHWLVRARSKGLEVSELDYFEQLSGAYSCLVGLIPDDATPERIDEKLVVDGANSVGGIKLQAIDAKCDCLALEIRNCGEDGGTPSLIGGVDFIPKTKKLPPGFGPRDQELRCASLDANAERLVYFRVQTDHTEVEIVDGDKMLSLFAIFIREQLSILDGVECERKNDHFNARMGIVQASGANGESATYMKTLGLGLDVNSLPEEMQLLHEEANKYDVGIYFSTYWGGTILFSEPYLRWLESTNNELSSIPGSKNQQAALRLLAVSKLMNQAAPDALGGLLLTEAILRHKGWSVHQWSGLDVLAVERMESPEDVHPIVNSIAAVNDDTNSELAIESATHVPLDEESQHVDPEPIECELETEAGDGPSGADELGMSGAIEAKMKSAADHATLHSDGKSNGSVKDYDLSTVTFGFFNNGNMVGNSALGVMNGMFKGNEIKGNARNDLSEPEAEEEHTLGRKFFNENNTAAASLKFVDRAHDSNDGRANNEHVCTDVSNTEEVPTSAHEESASGALNAENVHSFHVEDSLEVTKNRRDEALIDYMKARDNFVTCKRNLDAATQEERNERDRIEAKRQEIDSAQALVKVAEDAMATKILDSKSKQIHEQLVLSASKNQGVAQELDERKKHEKHLEDLRNEMNSMIERLSRLEQATNAAQIEYDEANKKQKQLLDQYKYDNTVRLHVYYLYLISPKKQCSDKVDNFYQCKKDQSKAGDNEYLQSHCVNKVESVMTLSNEDDNFGKEYIGCNQRNIMRNFGTLDGRRLGPDEKPPSLSFVSGSRALTSAQVAQASKITTVDLHLAAEADNSGQKDSEQESDRTKNDSSRVAEKEEIKELAEAPCIVEKEEDKESINLKRIQEEFAAKEDKLRIEEEAAKLKELRRLEEKLKAQEASARKIRNAEKAQARAELRARKEAEKKEKEREKRARKKENRKADSNTGTQVDFAHEPNKKPEIQEQPLTSVPKRSVIAKYAMQKKKKFIVPPSIRNRARRRLIRDLITSLAVVAAFFGLFMLGNCDFTVIRELFGS